MGHSTCVKGTEAHKQNVDAVIDDGLLVYFSKTQIV